MALMCHVVLSIKSIEISHLIDFKSYFVAEIAGLREMERAGLLKIDNRWIAVEPRGCMLVRVIAMVIDRCLQTTREQVRFSEVI